MYYEGRAWHFCLAFGVRRTDELALAWNTWDRNENCMTGMATDYLLQSMGFSSSAVCNSTH